jgi:hypothetical protein
MHVQQKGGYGMADGEEMSREEFSVAYNGAGRARNHTIDVDSLAPALLAFGRLLREANGEINGKKSKAKILVASDFEHKCFQINFELVVTIYEHLKTLLGSEPVKTAKEILEWVGLLKPAGAGSAVALSYLAYMKWKKGRKVVQAQQLTDQDKSGVVAVTVEGDANQVHVHNHVYNLSNSQKALKATRDAFRPIGQDGFDSVELKQQSGILSKLDDMEIIDIVASCNSGLAELGADDPDIEETTAWLSVYSPVYDKESKAWRFNLGREHVYVDISETSISEDALTRGGALAEDAYQVRLEISTPIDSDGKKGKASYKILEVLKFIPAVPHEPQADLFAAVPKET